MCLIGRSKLPTLNDFPDFSSRRITSVNSFRTNERIEELLTSEPNDPIYYNDLHLKGLYGKAYEIGTSTYLQLHLHQKCLI